MSDGVNIGTVPEAADTVVKLRFGTVANARLIAAKETIDRGCRVSMVEIFDGLVEQEMSRRRELERCQAPSSGGEMPRPSHKSEP